MKKCSKCICICLIWICICFISICTYFKCICIYFISICTYFKCICICFISICTYFKCICIYSIYICICFIVIKKCFIVIRKCIISCRKNDSFFLLVIAFIFFFPISFFRLVEADIIPGLVAAFSKKHPAIHPCFWPFIPVFGGLSHILAVYPCFFSVLFLWFKFAAWKF